MSGCGWVVACMFEPCMCEIFVGCVRFSYALVAMMTILICSCVAVVCEAFFVVVHRVRSLCVGVWTGGGVHVWAMCL